MGDGHHCDNKGPIVVLFRSDLRIADNRALSAAAATGRPVIPIFVFDESSPGVRPIGGARRWWLHHSLDALSKSMRRLGSSLVLRRGEMATVVEAVVVETGSGAVFWNRRYDPPAHTVDEKMKCRLARGGTATEAFDGQLLHNPSILKTNGGSPYKVYSPFWRSLAGGPEPRSPVDAPEHLCQAADVRSDDLDDWNLLPSRPDWAGGLRALWTPGEASAHRRLGAFLDSAVHGYGKMRDLPGVEATSRLSAHLTNDEITPFQIFAALEARGATAPSADKDKFRKEVGWREFAYHLLFHHPELARKNYNRGFDDFPWSNNSEALGRWQRGETGYPIVDAGMRELWQTGWMHNRVRLIAASFLIKHLLIDWREGEKWFWDTLVDADPANNAASWQWVAGSGADAAPYFRIFNPVLQGEKFDPTGLYVRRYVPEISGLPDRFLHRPWDAPSPALSSAGVKLGDTYPVPIVDHRRARDEAMQAFRNMRGIE